ncbi:MAG: outer membrane beta-barrel protein [Bacteroidota bacterium]
MSDLEKHELDHLFQQGVEQYDFAFNEKAWEDMEQLLDQDKRRRILFWVLLGGLLLVVSIGSYLAFGNGWLQETIQQQKSTIGLNDNNPTTIPPSKLLDPSDLNSIPPSETNPKTPETPTYEGISIDETSPTDSESENSSIRPSSMTSNLPTKPTGNADQLSQRSTNSPGSSFSNNQRNQKSAPENLDLQSNRTADFSILQPAASLTDSMEQLSDAAFSNNTSNQREEISSEQPEMEIGRQLDAGKSEYLAIPVSKKDIEVVFNQADPELKTSDPVPSKNPTRSKTEITVGLAAGLEMVSAGTDDFGQFSYRFGLDTEYRFARTWSVGLGGHISRKIYEAQANDYKAPTGFWTRGVAAESTEAACTILEIPISATYYFNGFQRHSFYAKGGMTSYFMLREEYQYSYENPEPDLIKRWIGRNANQHYFALLHFATGFQQRLGRSYVIQYEPYVQIPVSGVGHGNVKLFTIGTTVRFNFGFQN